MVSDVFTFLVGGKAGEGVKKAGSVAAHIFSSMGGHVFQMDRNCIINMTRLSALFIGHESPYNLFNKNYIECCLTRVKIT